MLLPVHKDTKLLIFDCDGTIADNMSIHINAWDEVLARYQLKQNTKDISMYHGLPSENILKDIFDCKSEDIEKVANEIRDVTHKNLHQTKAIQPILDIIHKYHGKKKMLVISGGKRKNVLHTLESLGILDFFEEVISADDNHPKKNTVEAFSLLAEKYGVEPSQCHVFEDGPIGMINALKAGMTVTDVRNIEI